MNNSNRYEALIPTMVTNLMLIMGHSSATQPNTWYADWGKLLARCAQVYGTTPAHACCVFAALSPLKTINRNWAMFIQAMETGPESVREAHKQTRDKVARILAANDPFSCMGNGPKTNAFCRNLLGNSEIVTVDSITAQASLSNQAIAYVPPPMYRAVAEAVQHIAGLLHWPASSVQAEIWVLYRKSKPSSQGRPLVGDVNPLQLLAALNRQ